MLKLFLIAAILSAAPSRAPTFRLICKERQVGECSSDRSCQKHPSKNTLLKIVLPELVRVREAQGTMQQCEGETCGETWIVDARETEGGGWAVRHSATELALIDGQTGFFTRTKAASGPREGAVSFAFGICKRD